MKLSVEVPYADIDAMGHLNNVASVRYLEWARQKYWLAMRGSANASFIMPAHSRTSSHSIVCCAAESTDARIPSG